MSSVIEHQHDQKLTRVPVTASEVLAQRVQFYKDLRQTYRGYYVWSHYERRKQFERKLPSD